MKERDGVWNSPAHYLKSYFTIIILIIIISQDYGTGILARLCILSDGCININNRVFFFCLVLYLYSPFPGARILFWPFFVVQLDNLLENWLSGQTHRLICIAFKHGSRLATRFEHWISAGLTQNSGYFQYSFHAQRAKNLALFMHDTFKAKTVYILEQKWQQKEDTNYLKTKVMLFLSIKFNLNHFCTP